jgi:uncharacterized membrane protein
MSEQLLRTLLVVDAVVIAIYVIVAWGADVSPLALSLSVVAAMVTQIVLVVQPRRTRSDDAASTVPPDVPDR